MRKGPAGAPTVGLRRRVSNKRIHTMRERVHSRRIATGWRTRRFLLTLAQPSTGNLTHRHSNCDYWHSPIIISLEERA
jgi:hypothetical protein